MITLMKNSVEGFMIILRKISPKRETRNKKTDKSKEKVRKYLVSSPKYLVSQQ